ncbi:MAG: tRNA dihydrouridine(20/20a) synthase DusA [Sinobacteraceae bacterium]|nr:tRNA dihydrouridine(20/20a) synthase DusA [Nevskiaceae bacterium]
MMDWTDRHCRAFHRRLSRHARLYTEMVTSSAILHGDQQHLLGFDPSEHPIALQLGGCNARDLARCARIGVDFGYDEINLNCCCPSDRVQKGRFGACLMREPQVVAEAVAAMRAAVDVPVTVKCRLGIDDSADYVFLRQFVDTVAAAGSQAFIIHARKAWLQGLSPRENREIPPLRHNLVHRLKQERPELTLVTNGGLATFDDIHRHLSVVDGVMLGRAAYHDPWLLAAVDTQLFDSPPTVNTREDVLIHLQDYAATQLACEVPLARMTRHWLGLYRNQPGGRAFRRRLSEDARRPGSGVELLAPPYRPEHALA